jgi:hypothetical protein
MKNKKRVYIAGKITGEKYYRQKFAAAERKLKARGYEVINPARMVKVEKWKTYRDYLQESMLLLFQADFIYALPCWTKSKGATLEVSFAMSVGIMPANMPEGKQ